MWQLSCDLLERLPRVGRAPSRRWDTYIHIMVEWTENWDKLPQSREHDEWLVTGLDLVYDWAADNLECRQEELIPLTCVIYSCFFLNEELNVMLHDMYADMELKRFFPKYSSYMDFLTQLALEHSNKLFLISTNADDIATKRRELLFPPKPPPPQSPSYDADAESSQPPPAKRARLYCEEKLDLLDD